MKVVTVEFTLPLAHMGADDDRPMLRLITVCFIMAGILLIPAGIETVRAEAAPSGGSSPRGASGGDRGPCVANRLQGIPSFRNVAAWRAARIPAPAQCQWPFCEHPSLDFHGWPPDEKLRLALTHPVRENRMLAIELLGESADPSALSAFREPLATESDPHILVEIARAVARIGGDEADDDPRLSEIASIGHGLGGCRQVVG